MTSNRRRGDVNGSRWVVIHHDDQRTDRDFLPLDGGIAVEGLDPAPNRDHHLTDKARPDLAGNPALPADHRVLLRPRARYPQRERGSTGSTGESAPPAGRPDARIARARPGWHPGRTR